MKVTNFDSEKITKELIKELFVQAGPVVNVVLRPDHCFVEFVHKESVSYAIALMHGVHLFGREVVMEPKVFTPDSYSHLQKVTMFQNNPHLFMS